MNKKLRIVIFSTFCFCLLAGVTTYKILQAKEFARRTSLRSSSTNNIEAIKERIKRDREKWDRDYGGVHPRATIQKAEVELRSKRLLIEAKNYMPGMSGDADITRQAVSFYLDGQLQEQSLLSKASGLWGVFLYDLRSKEPVISGKRYKLEVLDRDSGDRQKREIEIRNGKVIWLK